jgi:hypothetical protein
MEKGGNREGVGGVLLAGKKIGWRGGLRSRKRREKRRIATEATEIGTLRSQRKKR